MNSLLALGNEFFYEQIISFGTYDEFVLLKQLNSTYKKALDNSFFNQIDSVKDRVSIYRNGIISHKQDEYTTVTYTNITTLTATMNMKHNNGKLYCTQEYRNGHIDGQRTEYDKTGRIVLISNFKEGQLHGSFKRYKKNNLVFQTSYHNGKIHGAYKKYFEHNQQLNELCFYKHGKLDGVCTVFNERGDMIEHKVYSNDKLINK